MAMRTFQAADVDHLVRGKQKLSELSWLMKWFETFVKDRNLWKGNFTAAEANDAFSNVFDSVCAHFLGDDAAARRGIGPLVWQTVHNKFKAIHFRRIDALGDTEEGPGRKRRRKRVG